MSVLNLAQTSPNHADSTLRTRFYNASVAEVAQTAQQEIPRLRTYFRAWKLVETSQENEETTLRCEVPVVVFTDDLTVSIRTENNRTRVDVRSKSRVGKGDFGENSRHIRQFLEMIDSKFSS